MYKFIKHRGLPSKNIKENTYEAILNALNNSKYVGVEFDIRSTLDNEFIVFHNSYYNNKLIKNTLYKELPKYVPKLETILKINSNKIFLIEIKDIFDNYNKLIKLLNKYKSKNIYVMSFSNQIINKMNSKNRTYKVGILNYVLNTSNINKLDFICILNSLINKSILSSLKNIEVFSYGLKEDLKDESIYYITDR